MNTTTQFTHKEISAQWKYILKEEKEMLTREGDAYYAYQEKFNTYLRVFLRTDFSCLRSRDILTLCAMVQKYRPVALHSFLITCSNLVNA